MGFHLEAAAQEEDGRENSDRCAQVWGLGLIFGDVAAEERRKVYFTVIDKIVKKYKRENSFFRAKK